MIEELKSKLRIIAAWNLQAWERKREKRIIVADGGKVIFEKNCLLKNTNGILVASQS